MRTDIDVDVAHDSAPLQWLLSKTLRKRRKYRLFLALAIICAVAIVFTYTIVSRLHSNLVERTLLRLSEEDAVWSAMLMQSMMRSIGAMHLEFLASREELEAHLRDLIERPDIAKLNLFDLNRRVLWSTDSETIGLANHSTPLIYKAIQGEIGSKFVSGKPLVDVHGMRRIIDAVETYVPIRDLASGQILGIMEIYRDVSQDFSKQVREVRSVIVRTTTVIIGGLFLVLVGFTLMADATIYRANERELSMIETQLVERQRAEEALQESEERFRNLIEHSVQGIIIHQGDTPLFANQAYADILGYASPDAILRLGSMMPLFAPHEHERIRQYRHTRMSGGEVPIQYEYQGMRQDGSLIWLDNKVGMVNWRGKSVIQCSVFDITERKWAEADLKIRARQQAVVADLGQQALAGTQLAGLLHDTVTIVAQTLAVDYCKIMESLADGKTLLLLAGVGWHDGLVGSVTVDARDDSQAGYTLRSREPVVVDDLRTETRFSGPQILHDHSVISGVSVLIGGLDRPYGVLGVHTVTRRHFTRDDVHFLQAVAHILAEAIERKRVEEALREARDELERRVQDRTTELSQTLEILQEQIVERQQGEEQLRRSQAQLRALSTRLLSIQEEERRRLAREIHDELGQSLTVLKIDLAWVRQHLTTQQEVLRQKTVKMSYLIDATTHTMRRLATNLRPKALDDLGLVAALEWQVHDFQEHTGIVCALTIDPEDMHLDAERSTTVFRIVQEALTNVARHAYATHVTISLRAGEETLELEVRDNGRGISEQAVADAQSLGLVGIRERVLHWDGDVHIQGHRNQGTVLVVRLPLTISRSAASPLHRLF
jgi:PAS domain S-box-containing protein